MERRSPILEDTKSQKRPYRRAGGVIILSGLAGTHIAQQLEMGIPQSLLMLLAFCLASLVVDHLLARMGVRYLVRWGLWISAWFSPFVWQAVPDTYRNTAVGRIIGTVSIILLFCVAYLLARLLRIDKRGDSA